MTSALMEARNITKRFGGGHPSTTEAAQVLAKVLAGQRRYGEAESILRASLAAMKPAGGEEYERFQTLSELGALAAAQRHWSTAEPLLREAYAGLLDLAQSTQGLDSVRETGERLVDLYTAQGESAQAVDWRQRVAADAARLAVRVAK